jgi:hypothetical protein
LQVSKYRPKRGAFATLAVIHMKKTKMPKYTIYTRSSVICSYTIRANTQEEAEEKFWNGEPRLGEEHEIADYINDSEEEIIEVRIEKETK